MPRVDEAGLNHHGTRYQYIYMYIQNKTSTKRVVCYLLDWVLDVPCLIYEFCDPSSYL